MMHRLQYLLLAILLLLLATPTGARDMLPPGFVYLRDIDSSIVQDMRYATADNFTGHPLPGYAAGECILRREAAEALRRVQADLASAAHDPEKWKPVFGLDHAPDFKLGLKVYDCYRPTRAVRGMMAWAHDGEDSEATRRFYPAQKKRNLSALGYIAAQSTHSTGTTVDLTLIRLPAVAAPAFDPAARYGPCTGPAAKRAPDNSIDMGTSFDCFDIRSSGGNTAITPEQRRWRGALNTAMRKRGFANYFREWWHYSFTDAPEPRAYDFAITPRGR